MNVNKPESAYVNSPERMLRPGSGSGKSPARMDPDPARDPELMKACAGMEAQFINYLFKELRETIPESGFIPRGTGEKIYTSMLDAHLAEDLSQTRGIGLAPILYDQLSKLAATSGGGEEKRSECAKVFPHGGR